MKLASKEDYPRIEQFYLEVIADLEENTNYPLWRWGIHPDEKMVRDAIDSGEMYFDDDENGRVICAGQLTFTEPLEAEGIPFAVENGYGAIHLFGILPEFRGKGISGRKLRELIAIADERGCPALRLDLIEGNLPAKKLYLKNGFVSRGCWSAVLEKEGLLHFELMELVLD